jgi:hypothetical protein
MFLHAQSLTFKRPGAAKPFSVSAPAPEDWQAVIEKMRAALKG